ncbi:hypothetical protein GXP67_02810 [Rhodocytophaga rosea]|uniref:Uncharacterized protein n=1 Tax=Rhodocytophaga rosea TaxID=2704465 RepID=A0A6C0GCH5_9BACT|nr:hypothetical protein [Rhodocytophaga rosea]QHT65671.1 hypothetical protein GXP67_02810 [Rhodocytophaga rosea]
MIHYSIYERFKVLKLRPTHQAMWQVGLLVRDLYVHTFGVKPEKRSVMLNDKYMEVNVYPESFIGKVDEQIKLYCASHQLLQSNTTKAAQPKTAAVAQATAYKRQERPVKPPEKLSGSNAADDRPHADSSTDPAVGHPSGSSAKRERKRITVKKIEPIMDKYKK